MLFAILLSGLAHSMCWASGGSSEQPAEGQGEKSPEVVKVKSGGEDYHTVLGRVQGLAAQLKVGEDRIRALGREKKGASEHKQEELTHEMLKAHKELQTTYREYRQEATRLQYDFPDKGDSKPRRYLLYRMKSLREIEHGTGLESDLERARLQMRKTYGETTPSPKRTGADSHSHSSPAGKPELEPLVLKK